MATYDFIVSGVDPEMTLQSAASSDSDAWREAVLFLSEILRERPVREGASSRVRSSSATWVAKSAGLARLPAESIGEGGGRPAITPKGESQSRPFADLLTKEISVQ